MLLFFSVVLSHDFVHSRSRNRIFMYSLFFVRCVRLDYPHKGDHLCEDFSKSDAQTIAFSGTSVSLTVSFAGSGGKTGQCPVYSVARWFYPVRLSLHQMPVHEVPTWQPTTSRQRLRTLCVAHYTKWLLSCHWTLIATGFNTACNIMLYSALQWVKISGTKKRQHF